MLCINKANKTCQKFKLGTKTSKENKAKKRINTIDNILGVQKIKLLVLVVIKV